MASKSETKLFQNLRTLLLPEALPPRLREPKRHIPHLKNCVDLVTKAPHPLPKTIIASEIFPKQHVGASD